MNKEIKSYKLLDTNFPPNPPIKDAKLYVLNQSTQKVETYITDMFGTPKPLKDDTGGGGGGTYTFYSSDNSISISGTNNVNLILESSLKALINSALQSGDNISELVNDENYITLGDIPAFDPSNYDLTEFTNVDVDPFARISDLVGVGATNLTYTASPTQGTVNSDTGTDAVVPLADGTNAGLITPAEKILVSTALQSGDNISELNNDVGYISSVTGDWTGTFDGQEGSYYLDYNNFTNTPTIPSQLSDLSDVNTSIPTNRNVLVADGVDWESRALTEADISDLQTYLTTEVNDLTASVVWTNVPDANITESSVTQHEAALTITESQISDLSHFIPTDLPTDYGITLSTVATSNDYNDLDNLPAIVNPTENQIEFKIQEATVYGMFELDLATYSDFYLTMTAATELSFKAGTLPAEGFGKRFKMVLTGAFPQTWADAYMNSFGDDYDGAKLNDVLCEVAHLAGGYRGEAIYQQRETA